MWYTESETRLLYIDRFAIIIIINNIIINKDLYDVIKFTAEFHTCAATCNFVVADFKNNLLCDSNFKCTLGLFLILNFSRHKYNNF